MLNLPSNRHWHAAVALVFAVLAAACTPAYDWREVHGTAAPFSVLMPAKPTVLARQIKLIDLPVTMTMSAVEIDQVAYAVGSVELPDAQQASAARDAMQSAMVKNIHGKVNSTASATATVGADSAAHRDAATQIEALGSLPDGHARLMLARFVTRDRYAYQVVVSGEPKRVVREQADTFLRSFKPE
ncbi:MAG: hypothetical protein M3N23_11580 [Pseudomonadota bacterium]|nr:hypothetical protein [Pseudomonadota bacterium]